MKPLGIEWPKEPIKARGVFFTHDKKSGQYLSSRGLPIYGKVTLIKSLLIPKIVYISSLLPTPEHIINELNQLLYKFLK